MGTARPGDFEVARRHLAGTRAYFTCFAVCFGLAAFGLLAATTAVQNGAIGPLTHHMGAHILLMNVLAPLAAFTLVRKAGGTFPSGRMLAAATVSQLGALGIAHTPAALNLAAHSATYHLLQQAGLFIVAWWFWWAIIAQPPRHSWRSILSLLITGKLFCMLGVLLVFAPRVIYPDAGHGHWHGDVHPARALEDQQLAGLLMLVACPLSYVLAGVVMAGQWLRELPVERTTVGTNPRQT